MGRTYKSILRYMGRLSLLMGLAIILMSLGALNTQGQQSSWFEFNMPWDDGSPSFVSFNNDAVTDIRVCGDDFCLGNTSEQIRFFGINMTGGLAFPTHARAEKTAARLEKLGFNMVRFTQIDSLIASVDPITLDSDRLDKLHYFISQLKDHGIYVYLNLFDRFGLKNQPGFPNPREHPTGLFDPTEIQRQKDAAEELLTTVNPYTGLSLAGDPVLAVLQFNNEMPLINSFQICELDTNHRCSSDPPSAQHLTSDEAAILDQKWNEKLLAHYGDRTTLETAWQCTGKIGVQSGENPLDGTVERVEFEYNTGETADQFFCAQRLFDETTFYYQVEQEYVQEMLGFLTDPPPSGLGLEIPITTMENFYGVANKMVQAQTGTMAHHSPWAHPLTSTPGFMDPPFKFVNWPMAKGPIPQSELSTSNWDSKETRNTIWRSAVSSAVKGKPYIVSEVSDPLPNEFAAENPVLTSAYALLQGWDGIILHEYGNAYSVNAQASGDVGSNMIEHGFELADNAAIMSQVPAAARLFREGWVTEATSAIDVPFWEDGEFNGDTGAMDDWWQCHGDYYCYWESSKPFNEKNVDPAWSLVHKLRMEFTSGPQSLPPEAGTSPSQPYSSDTGELLWDMGVGGGTYGLVTIDSNRVNAAIGSVDTDPQLSVLKIDATTDTDFAAIGLVPLDGKPLNNSEKLLLTAAGRLANTGMDPPAPRSLGEHTLNGWGQAPVKYEPVQAQITLTLPGVSTIAVYRLDETGNVDTAIPVTKSGNDFRFNIGNQDTLWYGIEVQPATSAAAFRVERQTGDVLADGSFNSGGADLAERIDTSEPVEPGDVVAIDPANPKHYRKARQPYSRLAAGVIAAKPGFTLANRPEELHPAPSTLVKGGLLERLTSACCLKVKGDSRTLYLASLIRPRAASIVRVSVARLLQELAGGGLLRLTGRPLLALMGRVFVKATTENGPIRPGDLLVSASKPGYLMRCPEPSECVGAIIGKALTPLAQDQGEGLIQALVMSR